MGHGGPEEDRQQSMACKTVCTVSDRQLYMSSPGPQGAPLHKHEELCVDHQLGVGMPSTPVVMVDCCNGC